MYLITQEGLTVLINNYAGEKALYFSILLSKRFKAMQEFIRNYILAKDEFPIFTQAIEDAYSEPNSWHFKNEIDLLYRGFDYQDRKSKLSEYALRSLPA